MSTDIEAKVRALSDAQAVAACDALILLLASRLEETRTSRTAQTVDATDYEEVLQSAGPAENELRDSLGPDDGSESEVAGTARAMLLLATDLGYSDLVDSAVSEGETHVRDLGVVSGVLILGALAVVLSWTPVEQRVTTSTRLREGPGGTWTEELVTEHYTKRVGTEGVKAFCRWLKGFLNAA
jgi:hypothetical protein